MTDTLTTRDPWHVITTALINTEPGHTFSAATWHDQAVLAELKPGQIVAAQKRAVDDGYLQPIGQWIDGEWSPNMTRTRHVKGDGRWIVLYRRTSQRLPGQDHVEVAGQAALWEAS